ncbi:MAG TPA: hypothetical protein VK205_07790 [Prolixibacteraceae bacterium]|nr:hypothetical protein [Prolixibacteraceae bacterium]
MKQKTILESFHPSILPSMSPKHLLLALLFLAITFSACKKTENNEVILTNPSLLIKTATQYQDGKVTGTTTYEYDNLGRIAKISYNAGRYEKYNYVSDTLLFIEAYSNMVHYNTDTLLLNSRGLVAAHHKKTAFEYDSEGFLVKSTTMNYPADIKSYEVGEGNVLGYTFHQFDMGDNSETLSVYTCQYLENSVNTIGYENMGISFYGKQSKNLLSKSHLKIIYTDFTREFDAAFSYQFDRYRRVIRQTQDNSPVSYYTVFTYND